MDMDIVGVGEGDQGEVMPRERMTRRWRGKDKRLWRSRGTRKSNQIIIRQVEGSLCKTDDTIIMARRLPPIPDP